MDDRQQDIKAGAGLEDSRINKEFIAFLNKWSSPVILVLAVAALVWAGLGKLEQMKLEKIDRAFADLQSATIGGNPSPASLNAIASDYDGIRSVSEIAKLTTADLYIASFIRGVQPGAQIDSSTGNPVNETDALDDNQRQSYLDQAATLAQEVIASTEADDGKAILTMHGLIRAGAVAECKRDFDGAKAYYARVIEIANRVELPALAIFGQARIDAVDSFDPDIALPNKDSLVALPGEELPDIPEIPESVEESIGDGVEDAAEDSIESSEDVSSETPAVDQPETDQP